MYSSQRLKGFGDVISTIIQMLFCIAVHPCRGSQPSCRMDRTRPGSALLLWSRFPCQAMTPGGGKSRALPPSCLRPRGPPLSTLVENRMTDLPRCSRSQLPITVLNSLRAVQTSYGHLSSSEAFSCLVRFPPVTEILPASSL